MTAAEMGQVKTVQELIRGGADVNLMDKKSI